MSRIVIHILIFFWSTLTHGADAHFTPSHSVKSQGMGGVGIALPLDSLSVAANPAGAAFLADRIDVGITRRSPDSSTQIEGNKYTGDNGIYFADRGTDSSIPEFGFVKAVSQNLSIGLAVRRDSTTTRYNANSTAPTIPYVAFAINYEAVGYRLDRLLISPTITYRVNESNAIGVSLAISRQRIITKGLNVTYATATSVDATPRFRPSSDASHNASGKGIRLGWTGNVAPNLTLGATWASRITSDNFGNGGSLFPSGGHFDIPAEVGIGASYQVAPDWTLAFDVSRIRYGSVNRGGASAYGENFLSWPNLPGSDWKDATTLKFGVSHAFSSDVTLRAGYSYSEPAIPAYRTYHNILLPAVVSHRLSLGASWKTPGNGELSATFVHGFKRTQSGAMTVAPIYFGGGNVHLTAQETSFGLAYGWNF